MRRKRRQTSQKKVASLLLGLSLRISDITGGNAVRFYPRVILLAGNSLEHRYSCRGDEEEDQTHDILGKEGEHVNSAASPCGPGGRKKERAGGKRSEAARKILHLIEEGDDGDVKEVISVFRRVLRRTRGQWESSSDEGGRGALFRPGSGEIVPKHGDQSLGNKLRQKGDAETRVVLRERAMNIRS